MVMDVEEDSAFEQVMEDIRENADGFSMVKDVVHTTSRLGQLSQLQTGLLTI
jgi:hypothetical protein